MRAWHVRIPSGWETVPVRLAFLLSSAAYAVLVVVAAVTMPDRVPLHFGPGGDADRWGSRAEALLVFGLLGGGVALVLGGISVLARRLPLRSAWVNLPHKDWWTATPEREERARRRLSHDFWAIAAGTMTLLCIVLALTIGAAHSESPRLTAGPWLAVGALAAALLLAIVMPLRYRPDGDA